MKHLPTVSVFVAATLFVFLFIYVAYRASNLAFTHDECNTFSYVKPSDGAYNPYKHSANNHPLNTWLMRQSYSITGSSSESALRFPNVLAFLVYSLAVWLLLKR